MSPNFDMENSKIKIIFPNFFIFTFIFVSISQKCLKKWVKNFLLGFPWKLSHNLILIWRIRKSDSFFHSFSSSFLFLPRLVKNVLKNELKIFSHRFSWKLPYNLILIWRNQKFNSFSQIFSSSSSILVSTFFPSSSGK